MTLTLRGGRWLAGLTGTMLVVAGCSGPGGRPDGGAPTASVAASVSTAPAPAAFDPPRTFDIGAGLRLPENTWRRTTDRVPALLSGTRAYLAAVDRMEIVDLTTGEVTHYVTPRHKAALARDTMEVAGSPTVAVPPVRTEIGGRARIVTAFAATVEGEGTTAPRPVIEVVSVDADSGEEIDRLELDGPPAEASSLPAHPAVVGARGSVIVLRIGEETTALDLATGKVAWKRAGFTARGVAGQMVVGEEKGRTVARGLDVTTGAQRWQSKPYMQVKVTSVSPRIFVAVGTTTESKDFFQLGATTTGKVVENTFADGWHSFKGDCVFDEVSVTVCRTDSPDRWVGAVDETGKWIWELPAAGRLAPTVTTAWHGAVYGSTDNGPVVLDAKTGKDRETRPGAAPVLVNEHFGVAAVTADDVGVPVPTEDDWHAYPARS